MKEEGAQGRPPERQVEGCRLCAVDSSEDAMISLALACEQGHVARTVPMEGTMAARQETIYREIWEKIRFWGMGRSGGSFAP